MQAAAGLVRSSSSKRWHLSKDLKEKERTMRVSEEESSSVWSQTVQRP